MYYHISADCCLRDFPDLCVYAQRTDPRRNERSAGSDLLGFAENGVLPLDGEWELYPDKLFTQQDLIPTTAGKN